MTRTPVGVGVALAASLATLLVTSTSYADFLRTSRTAHVYPEPDRHGKPLFTLEEGQEVPLLSPDKQNGYYFVRAPSGASGFVYKSLVRRFEGDPVAPVPPPTPSGSDPAPSPPERVRILAERVTLPRQLARPPLSPGQYRVHLIDVGTGLSVLVQGADFNLLFDGGSSDDMAVARDEGTQSRVLAYLWGAIGPSGGTNCVPEGDGHTTAPGTELTLDHVVLSHSHQDHASQLDEVLECYRVEHVWEPGVVNDAAFYERFVQAIAAETGVRYHTVAAPSPSRDVQVRDRVIHIPTGTEWTTFGEDTHLPLGHAAFFQVLFADGAPHADENQNSLVLRVQLGDKSLLLTGDAEAGLGRGLPEDAAEEAEGQLLANHRNALDVDILQVAHHGSRTSTRHSFLDAVSPEWALLSSGPKKFGTVTLPDPEIVAALRTALGERRDVGLLRTDVSDGQLVTDRDVACERVEKIGVDADGRPGGCDSWVIEVR